MAVNRRILIRSSRGSLHELLCSQLDHVLGLDFKSARLCPAQGWIYANNPPIRGSRVTRLKVINSVTHKRKNAALVD